MNTTEEKAPPARRAPTTRFVLWLVFSGDDALVPPAVFTPPRGAMPIGREVQRGLPLPRDPRASRHHATIHRGALGDLRLVDERSRNGTFVNGRRVEEALLADGDVIGVGDSYLVARAEPEGIGDAEVPALIGVAPAMRALRAAIRRVGPTTATALLRAESGCGKEVVARALHEAGRAGRPFVAVNCSAIPESVAESQLFGHLAGAFTGAVARPGLFRAADTGTLFLDEVGDLPEAVQPKLLRVLEDRMVLPVGATQPVACDVRIVAATNRDLEQDIAARRFRGDLFARLAAITIRIPPLRERREDVLPLLRHALGAASPRLSSALAEALLLHGWPYNVRELFAIAADLRIGGGDGEVLDLGLVADRLDQPGERTADEPEPPPLPAPPRAGPSRPPGEADDKEPPPDRDKLEALLAAHRGMVADVARAVRRSRKQVYRWIAHHGLDVRRYRG